MPIGVSAGKAVPPDKTIIGDGWVAPMINEKRQSPREKSRGLFLLGMASSIIYQSERKVVPIQACWKRQIVFQ